MLNVPVVMLVAAAAVLIGVIYVATGRGGELAFFQPDYAPLKMDQVTSTDVALFRPPTALWGYSMQATDEALSRISGAITERDIEISALQQQVADLRAAAAERRAYAAPQTSSRRDEPPARRPEPSTRPPGPGTPASGPGDVPGYDPDDPDIVLPERLAPPRDEPRQPTRAERDEPRQPTRAERDEPPAADQNGPSQNGPSQNGLGEPDTRPVTPGKRLGAAGPGSGDTAAPATEPWFGRPASQNPSSTGWAALPKRQPAGDESEDSR